MKKKANRVALSERLKKSKRTELEQKQIKHVRNFTPTHYSWQKRQGKKLTKKQRKHYKNKKRLKS